jgi:hypothetical protein
MASRPNDAAPVTYSKHPRPTNLPLLSSSDARRSTMLLSVTSLSKRGASNESSTDEESLSLLSRTRFQMKESDSGDVGSSNDRSPDGGKFMFCIKNMFALV